jgi:hypothetical protein
MKANLIISRLTIVILGAIFAATTAQQGFAQGEGKTCSVATLKGRYRFASAGYQVVKGAAVPLAVAGFDIYDGRGNLVSNSTLIVGGGVISENLVVPTGTYTVNEDCTGTLNVGANGVVLSIFVAPNGEAFDYVQTAPSGNVLAGTIRRVSHSTGDEQ